MNKSLDHTFLPGQREVEMIFQKCVDVAEETDSYEVEVRIETLSRRDYEWIMVVIL